MTAVQRTDENDPVTVFLSSTTADLGSFRQAAIRAIGDLPGYMVSSMESLVAEDTPPEKWSRREATVPDVCVGLLGWYYGTVPGGSETSITEQEFDNATAAGIERLMFLTDFEDPELSTKQGDEGRRRIQAFRVRIGQAGLVRKKVSSPDEFAAEVVEALKAWELRTFRGATLDVEEFFRPWTEGETLHGHQDPLVGHDDTLAMLDEFANSDQRALVLHAPWGTGKSRVLLDWARRRKDPVRFVRDGVELSRRALQMSATDQCVLVLEDWHERAEELRGLLDFLIRCAPAVKLITSMRSRSSDAAVALLRHGFAATHIQKLQLRPLSDAETRKLVRQILEADDEGAHLIAARTKGSGLAAVITARLVRRGVLSMREIERSEEFQTHVFELYLSVVEREVSGPSDRHRAALRLVALAGPIRPADPELMATLARFLEWKVEELHDEIERLEDAGLLLRRGGLLRVPVDAVRQFILLEACVARDGRTKGYAERALAELWETCGHSIMGNVAVLEWDAKHDGRAVHVLDAAWARLEDEYREGSDRVRSRIAKSLERVAPYQPDRVLDFVERAVQISAGASPRWVNDGLTEILRIGPLRHPALISRACDVAWTMAQGDFEQANSRPWSAERVLQVAAAYGPYKLVAAHEAFLMWAEGRSSGSDRIPGHRVAAYVGPLLAKEFDHSWADERQIHMRSGGLNYGAISTLRTRALDLVERIAKEEDPRGVGAAIKVLTRALDKPHGTVGRVVSDAEARAWDPEELDVLARLRSVRSHHRDPSVDRCMLHVVAWHGRHAENEALRAGAATLADDIHVSLKGTIELALTPAWELGERPSDPEWSMHGEVILAIAKGLVASDAGSAEIAQRILGVLGRAEALGTQTEPLSLLCHFARLAPMRSRELVDDVLSSGRSDRGRLAGSMVYGALEGDRNRGLQLLDDLCASQDEGALSAAANGYRAGAWATAGEETARRHLRTLLAASHRSVREVALHAVAYANGLASRTRFELLVGYDIAASPETGKEWAMAVGAPELLGECRPDESNRLCEQLESVEELEYCACRILSFLSTRVPEDAVSLMIRRVERAAQPGFEAVPQVAWHDHPFVDLPHESRRRLLEQLGPLLDRQEFSVRSAARSLLDEAADGHADIMREVRGSWVNSSEEDALRRTAESLSEPEALFEEEDLVVRLLRTAAGCGGECWTEVRSTLLSLPFTGVRTGAPGEPSSRDVAIRDRALQAAERCALGSVERLFYEEVVQQTQRLMDRDQQRFEENMI